MLVSGNQRPTELTSFTATGSSCDVIKQSYAERYADSYVAAMRHFLNVVQGTIGFRSNPYGMVCPIVLFLPILLTLCKTL